jgi:hypothetical protein
VHKKQKIIVFARDKTGDQVTWCKTWGSILVDTFEKKLALGIDED